ncbi:unnamed protein product [Didymodactylos carnosus]|uniref:Rho-GAP domain-containing protein n=1 Tax=Didymodactylos carnosus TaxID=1234261 RepID=A0A8S2GLJ3_9BILA|nr:unnamed protein product [Didymodactylos carnosus]CAF3516168.1 unnamed protein product [Didymodactylos carnosus]
MNEKSIIKQGWLKVKTASHSRWHRRYCTAQAENGARDLLNAETKQELESWSVAVKKAAFSRNGGGIFGQSLQETYDYAKDKTSSVPLIVQQCCEHLLQYGLDYVGLFRVPGKQSSIKELRDMYDRGISVRLDETYAPATVSSLLKIYLQSLPEPIIPNLDFDNFLEIGCRFKYPNENERDEKISRLKQAILNLPKINYHVLKYLCLFMKKISDQSAVNKMDTENLAVVFGSNIIRPPEKLDLNMIKGHNFNLLPLIKVFIDNSEELFDCSSSTTDEVLNDEQTSIVFDSQTTATKSSGFSSESSLLSSNDRLLSIQRSKSLQSVRSSTISSIDSGTLSVNSIDFNSKKNNNPKRRVSMLSKLDDLPSRRLSFTTCKEPSFLSADGDDVSGDVDAHSVIEIKTENEISIIRKSQTKLSASCDAILTKIENEIVEILPAEQKRPTMNEKEKRSGSLSLAPTPIRKMSKYPVKKSLVSKVGKSFSTLKSNVVKVLNQQPVPLPANTRLINSDNSQNGVNHQEEYELKIYSTTPQGTISKQRREELNLQHSDLLDNNITDSDGVMMTSSLVDQCDEFEKLKHEIDTLNNRLIKKELLIEYLTTTSQNERLAFVQERLQLTKTVQDLMRDNEQLRQQLQERDRCIIDKCPQTPTLKYSQNDFLNDITHSLAKLNKDISDTNEQQPPLTSTPLSTTITTTENVLLFYFIYIFLMSSPPISHSKEPSSPLVQSTFATPAATSSTTFDLPPSLALSNDEQFKTEAITNNDDFSQYATPTTPLSPHLTSSPTQHQSQSTPLPTNTSQNSIPTSPAAATAAEEEQLQTTSIVNEMRSLLTSEDLRFPLEDTWSFWFFKNDRNSEWKDNLIKLTTVSTVEGFWSVYNHMQSPGRLGQGCDYMFFKTNIQPMWEDINNRNGGRWVLNLNKNQRGQELETFWLFTMLSLIGDQYVDTTDHVNGAVVSIRSKGDRISLWTRDWKNADVTKSIGRRFREVADIPKQYPIFFESHEDQETKRGANSKALYKA